jgi:NADPH2:quinone reductase
MRALAFDRFGGPEVLHLRDVPDPQPAPGVAVVRLHAIGLNFADVYRRRGNYHLAGDPPWFAGYEGAGVVETLHAADDGGLFRLGDRVGFADAPYANAELCAVPLERLIPLPASVACAEAAAALLQGLTAQYLVRDSFRVQAGHHVLVHAAAGGVGLLLTQIAARLGATVVGVASSAEKAAAAREAGASEVIGTGEGWAERARAATPAGFDVVYDSVGSTLAGSLSAARTGGAVVFFGMAGGEPPSIDPRRLMDESKTVTGGDLWNVLTSAHERRTRAAELFGWMAGGGLRVRIAHHIPLAEGARAHALLEGRGVIGKIVLVP